MNSRQRALAALNHIDALAPGGGFIFATVHNTQANVPPENSVAMWETLQKYGVY